MVPVTELEFGYFRFDIDWVLEFDCCVIAFTQISEICVYNLYCSRAELKLPQAEPETLPSTKLGGPPAAVPAGGV